MRQRNLFGWWAAIATATLVFVVGARIVSLTADFGPPTAVAQDLNLDEPAGEGGGGDAAPAPKPAKKTGAEPAPQAKSLISWLFEALGWFYMLVFFALSFCLVALLVMNILAVRRDSVVPVALVEEFERRLNQKQYQEAYELAKGDESFLGQVLSAGLAKLSMGYPQAIEAMQETGEEENMKLEHRL
ncbi:MAG: MotA/TolQ/ExbB proton channel family protein, partial [Pirellulales bacterium]|nr:MotA/TolQ/ExbB proton channel family protein [Pirellulales bacterium]